MAAVELKKKDWKFNKKFLTWFKKLENENTHFLMAENTNHDSTGFP
jgi:CCR4-NOT transcriptional regulation complex NOT5 subunit